MGLHPSEGISTDSYYHTTATGLRQDKYNWWFTNTQFRVGNALTYLKYDGTSLRIKGGSSKYVSLNVGGTDAQNNIAITSNVTSGVPNPSFNNANTPFYVNGLGQFSLGTYMSFDPTLTNPILNIGGTGSTYNLKIQTGNLAANNVISMYRILKSSDSTANSPTYNSVDTPFYLDGAGQFSLGTGLTWNGSSLSITGSATFSGSLSAATGTFAGSLSAATGTFSGSLSAATGTFAGSLSAATGTFSGALSAATGSFASGTIANWNINSTNGIFGYYAGSTTNIAAQLNYYTAANKTYARLQVGAVVIENTSGWESSSGTIDTGGGGGFGFDSVYGFTGSRGDFYVGYGGGQTRSYNSRIYTTSASSSSSPDSFPSSGIRNIWLTSTTGTPTTSNAKDGDIFLVWA